MALSVVPLHSLSQDDQNGVQHDIFGNVTPLVTTLESHDTDGVINGPIAFLALMLAPAPKVI